MECNREEAVRAREIAEKKFEVRDFSGAKKFLIKAQALFPELEGVSQMLAVVDVHMVAAVRVGGNEMDWYGILQVEQLADDSLIKRQYRKLALLLHPDKNKFTGAEAAFKLIGEAVGVLSDKPKRLAHDIRRRSKVQTHIPDPKSQFATRYNQPATPANASFWTTCPFCRTNFQYLRMYLDTAAPCQRCHRPFIARDMYAPPQNGANVSSGKGSAHSVPPAPTFQQQDFHFPTQNMGNGAPVTGNGFAGGGVGAPNGNVPPASTVGFMGVGVGSMYGNAPSTNAAGFTGGGVGSSHANVPSTNAAGTASHMVQETFQKVKSEREAEREAKRIEKEKEKELRRQEREMQKQAKKEAKIKEALDRLLAKRKESVAKQKVTENVVPRKRPLKKKRGVVDDVEEEDDDDEEEDDEMFQPATSGATGPGLSSNIFLAPRRSRRVKRNVMYMLDGSDDDLEDFPASRKAGMHMATDRKPNGEWRDGMDEANGDKQQNRIFVVDDGVEPGSNTGDRMVMGVREMDNKGGNTMTADIEESGEFRGLDSKVEAQGSLPESNRVQLEVNVPPACTEDLSSSPESLVSDQPTEVIVPDADFHDFDADRRETDIQAGHFWAVYDDQDSMPRFYCRIDKVQLHPFKATCHWLESVNHPKHGATGVDFSKVSPGAGDFKIAGAVDFNQVNIFSHLMLVEKIASRKLFKIYPRTGQVWAMYRMPMFKSQAQDKLQYEMVEIQTDISEVTGVVSIVSLIKLENFKTFWRPVGPVTQLQNLWRFSHRVPSFRLRGDEQPGLTEDCWELDPASTLLS